MTEDSKDPLEGLEAAAEEASTHPFLSNADVEKAKADARKKVEAQRKKTAMAAIEAEETLRLQREEGLTTGDTHKDEIVTITLDLAEHSSHILLNGAPFWHGHTYTVPRHTAETLREIMQRGWQHQDEIDGKSLTQHYQRQRVTHIDKVGGVHNAPVKAA